MGFPHTQVQSITVAAHPGEQISRAVTVLTCCDELLTVTDELKLFREGVTGYTSHQHVFVGVVVETLLLLAA